uniref:Fanconi anemia group I protein n=1 Tax=Heterorhabditis bacteriophora TaxID=37862 RepID=A0A1I7XMD1_HETBA
MAIDGSDDMDLFDAFDEIDNGVEEHLISRNASYTGEVENGEGYKTGDDIRTAFLKFTQRTQRGVAPTNDIGEFLDPRNDFEKILLEEKVELRRDDNCRAFGGQDTVFRALLLCKMSQTKAFDILLYHMQLLANEKEEEMCDLALICVAHIRFLDRVFDSQSLFQSIFDRDFDEWSPGPRDALIKALPEVTLLLKVLTDPLSQQNAALNLQDMILRRVDEESISFKMSILSTLILLRTDGNTARKVQIYHHQIRRSLVRSAMTFEPDTLPFLITYCIETLVTDDKSTFKDILNELASYLRIDQRCTIDEIVLEIFNKLARFVQLEGAKGWKEVVIFLKKGNTSKDSSPDDLSTADSSRENSDEMRFDLFEVLLSFSLLSVDGCRTSVISSLKNQLTQYPDYINNFLKNCKTALSYNKFCVRHFSSLSVLARHCLWCIDDVVHKFGASIYKELGIKVTLHAMLSHLSKTDSEAEAILGVITQLIDESIDIVLPFTSDLQDCLDLLEVLSMDNIKRLFNILISIYMKIGTEIKLKLFWADELLASFRTEFFTERSPEYEPDSELENNRYARKESTLWLTAPRHRLMELVPQLELLKELALMKQRWCTDDDTQMAIDNHWERFFFVLEANIGMSKICASKNTASKEVADILYHTIDWIRMVLNTFSSCEHFPNVKQAVIQELWIKKFSLMFECQKQLISTIGILKNWSIPSCLVQHSRVMVTAEQKTAIKRKRLKTNKGKKEKQMNDQAETVNTEETEGEQEEQLIPNKRRATAFLMEQLLNIMIVVIPKKVKKIPIFVQKKESEKTTCEWHGDSNDIWKNISKVLPIVWTILDNTAEFFRGDLDSSNIIEGNTELVTQMAQLMRLCLVVLSTVFSSRDVSGASIGDCDRGDIGRQERRRIIMEKVERSIIQTRKSQEESTENAELTLLKYLVNTAEVVPTLNVAVALLDTTQAVDGWTDELKRKLARHCIAFLKKEWRDEESKPLKGVQLSSPVKNILELVLIPVKTGISFCFLLVYFLFNYYDFRHYIRLRSIEERLAAVQWILANKIAELIPDDERQRSKISSNERPDDPEMTESDIKQRFACFTRSTITAIYKVLFSTVNNCISQRLSQSDVIKLGQMTVDECLKQWNMAASCFCLLGLLLRVKELRNASVLMTAVREGKRFLTLFSKHRVRKSQIRMKIWKKKVQAVKKWKIRERNLILPSSPSNEIPLNLIFSTCNYELHGICSFPTATLDYEKGTLFSPSVFYSLTVRVKFADVETRQKLGIFQNIISVFDGDVLTKQYARSAYIKEASMFTKVLWVMFFPLYFAGFFYDYQSMELVLTNEHIESYDRLSTRLTYALQDRFAQVRIGLIYGYTSHAVLSIYSEDVFTSPIHIVLLIVNMALFAFALIALTAQK